MSCTSSLCSRFILMVLPCPRSPSFMPTLPLESCPDICLLTHLVPIILPAPKLYLSVSAQTPKQHCSNSSSLLPCLSYHVSQPWTPMLQPCWHHTSSHYSRLCVLSFLPLLVKYSFSEANITFAWFLKMHLSENNILLMAKQMMIVLIPSVWPKRGRILWLFFHPALPPTKSQSKTGSEFIFLF